VCVSKNYDLQSPDWTTEYYNNSSIKVNPILNPQRLSYLSEKHYVLIVRSEITID